MEPCRKKGRATMGPTMPQWDHVWKKCPTVRLSSAVRLSYLVRW